MTYLLESSLGVIRNYYISSNKWGSINTYIPLLAVIRQINISELIIDYEENKIEFEY